LHVGKFFHVFQVDGTKLAAAVADPHQLFVNDCGDESGEIIVWNYPTCDILFQQKQFKVVHEIEWNQFRQEVFATYNIVSWSNMISFLNFKKFKKKSSFRVTHLCHYGPPKI
jgi:hypothetical protein